jgi:hypothetical protein
MLGKSSCGREMYTIRIGDRDTDLSSRTRIVSRKARCYRIFEAIFTVCVEMPIVQLVKERLTAIESISISLVVFHDRKDKSITMRVLDGNFQEIDVDIVKQGEDNLFQKWRCNDRLTSSGTQVEDEDLVKLQHYSHYG